MYIYIYIYSSHLRPSALADRLVRQAVLVAVDDRAVTNNRK